MWIITTKQNCRPANTGLLTGLLYIPIEQSGIL